MAMNYGFQQVVAETTVPVAVADGAPVVPWFDEYGRQIDRATNLAIGTKDVSDVAPAKMQICEWVWTQLTAVGNTASVNVEVYDLLQMQIVVGNIGVSVDYMAQGSLDNASFYNLDDANVATRQVANGVYQMHCDIRKNKHVRFRLDAENGANVTLDVSAMAGN